MKTTYKNIVFWRHVPGLELIFVTIISTDELPNSKVPHRRLVQTEPVTSYSAKTFLWEGFYLLTITGGLKTSTGRKGLTFT